MGVWLGIRIVSRLVVVIPKLSRMTDFCDKDAAWGGWRLLLKLKLYEKAMDTCRTNKVQRTSLEVLVVLVDDDMIGGGMDRIG